MLYAFAPTFGMPHVPTEHQQVAAWWFFGGWLGVAALRYAARFLARRKLLTVLRGASDPEVVLRDPGQVRLIASEAGRDYFDSDLDDFTAWWKSLEEATRRHLLFPGEKA